jgi:sulfate/thiosulfate transport system substrate-binding protein
MNRTVQILAFVGLAMAMMLVGVVTVHAQDTLTNASCDPTSELYRDFNAAFAAH